ncbi:MAG: UDP-N-acetylmuramoyl-L-alanyl-D-glutamate--2,6-diaminopimelate ligase [Planctomycetota bacterium]
MLLSELIESIGDLAEVRVVRGDAAAVRVADLTDDSRTVVPGSLFVARQGVDFDGKAFIADAIAAGASVVLADDEAAAADLPDNIAGLYAPDARLVSALMAERVFGSPSSSLLVAAVTCTNGKTTVSHIVHRLLNRCGLRCGLIGTVEIDDGTERVVSEATTPGSIELSRTLATMVEAGCRAVVLEASSQGLDQRRVDGVAIDAAVFTNLSGDHLDYHKTLDAYRDAKARLFELVDPDGLRVTNTDDDVGRTIAGQNAVRCSMTGGDWTVRTRSADLESMRLELRGPAWSIESRVELIGQHNAMNTLQAVVVCDEFLRRVGVDSVAERAARIGRALSLLGPPRGRLEPVHDARDDVKVFVDFAHTDDALAKALESINELVGVRKTWAVFGAGGDKDRSKRPRMGAVAARLAGRVVVTSDNPRTEKPSAIITEVLSGIDDERRVDGSVSVQADRAVAIAHAIRSAEPGDAVVIAGKGHETEQILPNPSGSGVQVQRFDDREEARKALAARRERTQRVGEAGAVAG